MFYISPIQIDSRPTKFESELFGFLLILASNGETLITPRGVICKVFIISEAN